MIMIEEICVLKDQDGTLSEYRHRHVFDSEDEFRDFLRPGFGEEFEKITYNVYAIEPVLLRSQEQPPVTMLEKAHVLHEYGPGGCTLLRFGVKVDVGLRGKGWDGPAVFWDSRGNSFAIVKPPSPSRLVSDQGVLLLSINGIGEIRWDVYGTSATMPENVEAVRHFGLTWSK